MTRLQGRVCVVTGAAQGIGAAYAKAMAGVGAKLTLCDVLDCEPVAQQIRDTCQGADVLALKTDVTSEPACGALVAETVQRYGRLDVMVANAALFGGLGYKGFEDIEVAEWDAVMAVNVKGPWLCIKAAAPQMKKQKYGKIVTICSSTVFKGTPNLTHYVSSKGAILAMTRALSRELGDFGIRVNALAPGLTRSEAVVALDAAYGALHDAIDGLRALKRAQVPEDLTGAMIFLASADSDFMTGQCMVVDGGNVNN